MKGQLKPGSLALVIGCKRNPVNIGKCVELVQIVQPGEYYYVFGNRYRYNVNEGRESWVVVGDGLLVYSTRGQETTGHTLAYPEHLMPLDGDPDLDKDFDVKTILPKVIARTMI